MTREITGALALLALGAACLAGGCGGDDDDNDNGDVPGPDVSYAEHVAPILEDNCTGCHAAQLHGMDRHGAPPEVNLDSYEAAVDAAPLANTRVQEGTMPPSGELSSHDKAVFQSWVDHGTPP